MEEVKVNSLDSKDLWRAEVYTDRKNGTINVMLPVDVHGQRDPTRKPIYQSVVALRTGDRDQQLGFVIDAVTLREAVDGWEAAAVKTITESLRVDEDARFRNSLLMPGVAAARVN